MLKFFDRIEKLEQRVKELESELTQAKYKYDAACFKRVGEWSSFYVHADPRPKVSAMELIMEILDANGMEVRQEFPSNRQYSVVKKEQS